MELNSQVVRRDSDYLHFQLQLNDNKRIVYNEKYGPHNCGNLWIIMRYREPWHNLNDLFQRWVCLINIPSDCMYLNKFTEYRTIMKAIH